MPRRDDDLFDTPPIVPDSEGRVMRNDVPVRPAPTPRSNNSSAPSATGGLLKQLLVSALFIALITACGYFHYQNTAQQELNARLQQRLDTLESQLGLSTTGSNQPGETLGDKVKAMDDRLKLADSEIRKLWGVTNDKNRKMLDSHDGKLGEHEKSLAALQGAVGEMKKSVAMTEKSVGETTRTANEGKQAAENASQAIIEMRSSVGALQQRLAQGDPMVREATQQAAMAQEQAEQLQSKVDVLNKKVAEHDESIRSIDIFRRSVNSDLGKLKQQTLGTPTP